MPIFARLSRPWPRPSTRAALATLVLAVSLVLAAPPPSLGQSADELAALERELVGHFQARRYVEAIPIGRRVLEARRALYGEADPRTVLALANIGHLEARAGRDREAEVTLKEALGRFRGLVPPDHAHYKGVVEGLHQLYRRNARWQAGADLLRGAAAELAGHVGSAHPERAIALNNLGQMLSRLGNYTGAEAVTREALDIGLADPKTPRPAIALRSNNLAAILRAQGRYGEAEPLYRRAIGVLESAGPGERANLGIMHDNFSVLLYYLGRYAETEEHRRKALTILEEVLGPEHASVGQVVANLADYYRQLGRLAEARPLFDRALAIFSKQLRPNDYRLGFLLDNMAGLYRTLGQHRRAEQLYRRALAIITQALGPDHPDVAHAMNNLALVLVSMRKFEEAETLTRDSLARVERHYGPDHREVAVGYGNLSDFLKATGRLAEARAAAERAVAGVRRALGGEHPLMIGLLVRLGWLDLTQGRAETAMESFREALRVYGIRTSLAGERKQAGAGEEAIRREDLMEGFVEAAWRMREGAADRGVQAELTREAFAAAQQALQGATAAAISQMSARFGAGSGPLADLVRERQDLSRRWVVTEDELTRRAGQATAKRNLADEATLRAELATITTRLGDLDKNLADRFPAYAQLVDPKPLAPLAVQRQLGPETALMQVLIGTEASHVWLVTATAVRWLRVPLTHASAAKAVRTLRCGLDGSAWQDETRALACADLVGLDPGLVGDVASGTLPLPFDLGTAHALYRSLLGDFEAELAGKQLILVAPAPLSSLPWQVLVTAQPGPRAAHDDPAAVAAALRAAHWLGRERALVVLPGVASLAALGTTARPSAASEPYLGVGDPVLTGGPACPVVPVPEHCPAPLVAARPDAGRPQQLAALRGVPRPTARSEVPLLRAATADAKAIRALCPLPDTAQEIRCVAATLGAPEEVRLLGAGATETSLRARPLGRYRILHFATHGLLSSEAQQLGMTLAEPALVMTPPDTPSADDDGLLTTSEIASLSLDADWVVLSACNTAAGERGGSEPLSGLARAFFYAGARTLLVSHWPVYSEAAVRLTAGTFAALEAAERMHSGVASRWDPRPTRAEALRRTIDALLAEADDTRVHPGYWGPFVVVGQGAARPPPASPQR
jgi:tetratricopeptide (TPR) repeat protein